ncbi:uncharacterized protein LOC144038792 isoform X2 [Vanacampus margaritifer]
MTTHKRRSSYFSTMELQVLLQAYKEHEKIFRKKGNTAVASKERIAAWQQIAAKVNSQCNQVTEKRTWQQLKTKYKNIVQTANRKKAKARKLYQGALPSSTLTVAEELVLSQVQGMPAAEAISAGSSAESVTSGVYLPVFSYQLPSTVGDQDLSATATEPTIIVKDEEILFASEESEPERPAEVQNVTGQKPVEGASAITTQPHTPAVTDLNNVHLLKKIAKTDKEMILLDRQIRKADLEIQLLECQLRSLS